MNTWILLRGLTREGRHWGDFAQTFREALPGAQVVALELPGNGDLNALASPLTIAGMAAHCRAEVARLGLQPPFRILAMSMGAMVAADWAAGAPGDVAACVLINTSLGGFNPLYQRLRPRAWPVLAGLLLARTARRKEQLVLGLTSRLSADPQGVIDAWVAIRQSRPVSPGNALRQMLAAARFHAPTRAPVPTLLLASAGDGLVDPRCSREIARRWNCTLVIHPTAGHDLPLDDGDWVVQQVRDWLESTALPFPRPISGKMEGGSPP